MSVFAYILLSMSSAREGTGEKGGEMEFLRRYIKYMSSYIGLAYILLGTGIGSFFGQLEGYVYVHSGPFYGYIMTIFLMFLFFTALLSFSYTLLAYNKIEYGIWWKCTYCRRRASTSSTSQKHNQIVPVAGDTHISVGPTPSADLVQGLSLERDRIEQKKNSKSNKKY